MNFVPNDPPRGNSSLSAHYVDDASSSSGRRETLILGLVQAIREDEQQFRKIQQDIRQIEQGEWDQRLLAQVSLLGPLSSRDGPSLAPPTPTTPLRPPAPLIAPLSIDPSISLSSTRWKHPPGDLGGFIPGSPVEPPYSPLSDVFPSSPRLPPERGDPTSFAMPDADLYSKPSKQASVDGGSVLRSEEGTHEHEAPSVTAGVTLAPIASRSGRTQSRSQSALPPAQMSPTSLSEMYPADIKQEPSGPASTTGVDEPASEAYQHPPPSFTALTAATSSSHEAQLPNPGVTRAGSKRKRPSLEVSETPEASGDLNPSGDSVLPIQTPIVPRQPALILATRNFPRTTAPLLNAIGAHRFASLFAAPVKEKAAPGYRETIYQPQDLKSIKAAIAHGSRAVAAAAASLSDNTSGVGASPSQAGTPLPRTASGGTLAPLWLPPNPDIVPPKGIVNSAQLEKELLRMFANAVMYNPEPRRGEEKSLPPSGNSIEETSNQPKDDENDEHDDDEGSVVKDAREMFQVVEKIITDWRAAERTAALDMGPTPLPDRPANAVRARSNNSHPSMGWDGAGDMEENSAAMSVKGEDAPDETLIESVEQQAEPGREGEGED